MFHLLDPCHNPIGTFETYGDIVDYINKTELSRIKFLNALNLMLGVSHVLDQGFWSFIYYEYDFLNTVYSCMKDPPLTQIEREAFRQGLDLIEIQQGNEDNPLQIPVDRNTDIESLQKEWCDDFCRVHGYFLKVTLHNETAPEPSKTGGSDDSAV